jgi:hypothetical protein
MGAMDAASGTGVPTAGRGSGRSEQRAYHGWLLAAGLAYAVLHHVGTLPDGLGVLGDGTRRADWIDLLTPYVVLLPALAALRAAQPARPIWIVFAVGAVAYSQGHGIHLAANSVYNDAPGRVAHLWDEDVGHFVWYAGAAAVTAALARTMRDGPGTRSLAAYAVAAGVGLTWATNAVGAGSEVVGLLVAVALAGYGLRHRRTLAATIGVGYLAGACLLASRLVV